MNEDVLVIQNVKKKFGDLVVLNNVNATIKHGSITAFIGPNGAGKTTLFHTIAGDLRADSGKVLLRGRNIGNLPPWKIARYGLGRLFQDVRVFRNLTILENVMLSLHEHPDQSILGSFIHSFTGKAHRAKVENEALHFLDQVGIEKPYDRRASELSWGSQKLLALARLFAGDFDVLLLDEPTAGISGPLVDRIRDMLVTATRERKITIALIEHNIGFVSRIAETTYVLREGEIFDHGTTQEVLQRPQTMEICIGL